MRWDELPRSDNVEDRRREEGGYGGGGFPIGTGGMGIGTLVVLGLLGWALGIDPRLLIGGAEILSGGGHSYHTPYRAPTNPRSMPSTILGTSSRASRPMTISPARG